MMCQEYRHEKGKCAYLYCCPISNIGTPKTKSEKTDFAKRNAPRMFRSTDALKRWVDYIKNE